MKSTNRTQLTINCPISPHYNQSWLYTGENSRTYIEFSNRTLSTWRTMAIHINGINARTNKNTSSSKYKTCAIKRCVCVCVIIRCVGFVFCVCACVFRATKPQMKTSAPESTRKSFQCATNHREWARARDIKVKLYTNRDRARNANAI